MKQRKQGIGETRRDETRVGTTDRCYTQGEAGITVPAETRFQPDRACAALVHTACTLNMNAR